VQATVGVECYEVTGGMGAEGLEHLPAGFHEVDGGEKLGDGAAVAAGWRVAHVHCCKGSVPCISQSPQGTGNGCSI